MGSLLGGKVVVGKGPVVDVVDYNAVPIRFPIADMFGSAMRPVGEPPALTPLPPRNIARTGLRQKCDKNFTDR